ncbi:hypothetical protein TIFTF001_024805 [Ficus carica]|uniref:Uncharacterized protein n=1 Tax=Ficus carica TaxID=3494 RepID=A0AA88AYA6_FICCA|nr:hypothetical protein TIFTF001_024805 [Ficus carica]
MESPLGHPTPSSPSEKSPPSVPGIVGRRSCRFEDGAKIGIVASPNAATVTTDAATGHRSVDRRAVLPTPPIVSSPSCRLPICGGSYIDMLCPCLPISSSLSGLATVADKVWHCL